MDDQLSRRDLLQNAAAMSTLALFGAAACNRAPAPLVCTDTTGLSATDVTVRTSLAYVDLSTDPTKSCTSCQQFVPTAPNACGTCKVLKGPINPKGNCKSFVAKPA